jgi:PIN domain nuclease of toxin-antitoxin system
MNLVTDTHGLVWYLSGQHRKLSAAAGRALREADAGRRTVHVPVVVLWEVVLLEQIGRLRLSYHELRAQLALRPGLPVEPLLAEDVDEARSLAALVDPFDRLIAATAVRLGLPLLTNDERIVQSSRLHTVW